MVKLVNIFTYNNLTYNNKAEPPGVGHIHKLVSFFLANAFFSFKSWDPADMVGISITFA